LFNFGPKTTLETGNWKFEIGNSKLEIGNLKFEDRDSKIATAVSAKCQNNGANAPWASRRQVPPRWQSDIVSAMVWRTARFASIFQFQVFNFRFRVSSFKFRVSDFQFQVSNFQLRVSNFQLRVSIFAKVRLAVLLVAALILPAGTLCAQVESVESSPAAALWVSHGRVEGHLDLRSSSDGAFSPDSSLLAVVADDKVMLMNLRTAEVQKVLKPRVPDIESLEIRSANFLSPHQLFLLANGAIHVKGKGTNPTPLLAFQWDAEADHVEGKVDAVGVKGGFSPARYFPMIGYLLLYKDSNFDLWNPRTGQGGRVTIPDLTHIPNLYEFSPDGHWLLLAQIQTTSNADPSVVELKTHKFVDELHGHEGTVLSMVFSRDGTKVVTTCADGKLRVYSAGDWKLIETLTGHHGPVHRAEFSPNGRWIASAGEDNTVRVWSTEDGTLLQTLQESQEPVLGVAFSPDSRFIAASTESLVLTWQRQGGN
jgi:WD40 repeat protein